LKFKRLYILHLLSILLPALAWSQDPFYINYDTNDGLPSSETYFIHEDTRGLIWIATDRGICTYNGYEFETYTTEEGLSHNTNFRIFSDQKDRLWFTALDGSLSVYENGGFCAISLNEDTSYNKYQGYAVQLLFDEDDNVFVAKDLPSSAKMSGMIFHLDANDFSVSQKSVFDFENLVWKDEEQREVLLKIGKTHLFLNKQNQFAVNVLMTDTISPEWIAHFNNHRIEQFGNNPQNFLPSSLKNETRNFYLDPKNNFWLCTPDGLLLYKDLDFKNPPRHFFKGLDVTRIITDREGSYWMTTREKGVYWIPSFQFRSLLRPGRPLEVQRVLSIGKLSDFLLFGTVNNGFFAVNKQLNLEPRPGEWVEVTETRRMYTTDHTIYTADFGSIKEIDGELKTAAVQRSLANNYCVKKLENGLMFFTGAGGYYTYTDDYLTLCSDEKKREILRNRENYLIPFKPRIYCLEEDHGLLWLGTIDGLYQLPTKDLTSNPPEKNTSEETNFRIEDIVCVDSQQLWIATMGNGLIFKNGEYYQRLSEDEGLSSNLINRICVENDSTLWIGSNKGLDKVRFRYQGQGFYLDSISNFSTSDGLISNYINDLTSWNDHLWLATNKGVNYFRPEEMVENETPPLIHIQGVLVGDRYINMKADAQLNYTENDLAFNFLGVSFRKPKNKVFYRYCLRHNEAVTYWYYTDNRSVRFLDLAPGDYTFEVAARNKNGYWSEQTAGYSFTINAHFTDQLWFRITAVVLLALLISFALFFRIQTIKKKEEQKRKLQNAELDVLRNQMNPHFVFNSLNSIQSFIFHQDVPKANYYLSKFSRLMRNSLEYSSLKHISINEEINFIRSYLELEKLRFDDLFEFEIEVSPDIPVHDYFIPPLLLQPVLENSVKYAFKNITHQGRISIQFLVAQPNSSIKVIIKDNGTGIIASEKKQNTKAHRSIGLSIIERRVKLLNVGKHKVKTSFEFSNRYNARQEIAGTQTIFIIPIQLMRDD